jgi:heme/copper-type cytochrome/quinol oxidase subunit 1
MERIGLGIIIAGMLLAFAASLPFLAGVLTGIAQSQDLSSNLIWQGWALGGLVAFVGMIVAVMDGSGRRHHMSH